ncbi:serine/threonine-protein kinase [Plantactinospora soyae]|uniref:non-specific serine/threonine protein kinase n=1 Tax=Plantactinospora soyae TaxID=1544732 RepID=A0A927M8F4_9ACTN|nr:serine/threonine-protein kinase [Plantactinospora soyae]MBE1489709.1 serine/threonine protein kinase [Plantactinospora soyae]
MIALLVEAVRGDARLVFANGGDWGIDALVGDLNGRVMIWQAKYFPHGVTNRHRGQIEGSFASAVRNASEHGYRVQEWVLCVPSSLDPQMSQWWDSWRQTQARLTGIRLVLWDETGLRSQLMRPAARYVRRAYYHPYQDAGDEDSDHPKSPESVTVTSALPRQPFDHTATPWVGGDERRIGAHRYLLHADSVEQVSIDHSWNWREATADRVQHDPLRVRLRQLQVVRDTSTAQRRRDEVRAQGHLLRKLGGRGGLPSLDDLTEEAAATTLVTVLPSGPSWRQAFGPTDTRLARFAAAGVLGAAAEVCATLAVLHGAGTSHRALGPDSIVLTGRTRRAALVDGGLAVLTPQPGEGIPGYRAPEQHRGGGCATPVDIYQVAALVYHSMTGHPPSPYATPPIRASLPEWSEHLDDLLLRCLDPDPSRRPVGPRALAAAFREGRRLLSQGDTR